MKRSTYTYGAPPAPHFRYQFRHNGWVRQTMWHTTEETARECLSRFIGEFHRPGTVAGDGDRNPDGSHPGCPRNGGLLSLDVETL